VIAIAMLGKMARPEWDAAAAPPSPAASAPVVTVAARPSAATPALRSDWPLALAQRNALGPRASYPPERVNKFTIDDVPARASVFGTTPPWVRWREGGPANQQMR